MKKSPKVAIVYDRVNKFGGAERVLLALRELYPQSVLFTSVFNPKTAPWVGDWEVRTSFLQKIPFAKSHHEWFAPLMPLAFETLDLSGFDLVISVTSEFAKNIITTPKQLHVCYCLTPTRYLWSHTHDYGTGRLSFFKHLIFSWLRVFDVQASLRPQVMIAISKKVQTRISTYYHRGSVVINPPLTLSLPRTITRSKSKHPYYLVVSRLVPYKRIDLAINACKKLKKHLHIVGTGSTGMKLLELAGNSPYIHFEGDVSDLKLSKLYAGAKALICPQEEDFGLVSLEAQAHGVPVVSYKDSGVAETILDGKTGILFTDGTPSSLCQAMLASEKIKWNHQAIRRHALKFRKKQFWQKLVHEVQLGQKRQKGKLSL